MSVILTRRNLGNALAKNYEKRGGPSAASAPGALQVSPSTQVDDSLTRIMKMIPGEATALYTAAIAVEPTSQVLPIVAFVACAVVVVLVVRRSGSRHSPPVTPEPLQYLFQLLAFVAWALAIHSPIAAWVTIPGWVVPLAILCIPVFGGLLLRDDNAEPAPQGAS